MVVSSAGLGSDCSGKGPAQHREIQNCQTEMKNPVISSRWEPDTMTHWPTDRRSKYNFLSELISLESGARVRFSVVICKVYKAKAREQFENPQGWERLPLEADTDQRL
jgi:hypothetical protein